MAGSAALRWDLAGAWYWIDEAQSIGIASKPLTEIPDVLRQDASPPLYYLLLHAWMAVVGTSEVQTHLLSFLLALATIPSALWAGTVLFDRRTGWFAAVLAATNPLLTVHSQETRMYGLVVLLALLATVAVLRAFLDADVDGRRGWLPAGSVLLAALLHTHTWGLHLAAALAAAGLVLALTGEEPRRRLLDLALAFGGAALLYAPWLPVLRAQVARTGAPWAEVPTAFEVAQDVTDLLGSKIEVLVLAALGGTGLVWAMRQGPRPQARAVVGLAIVAATTVALAFVGAQVVRGYQVRYLAVVLPALLLLAAAGLARTGVPGVVGLVVFAALSSQAVDALDAGRDAGVAQKGNVKAVAAALDDDLTSDDTVVSTQPEQVPVLARYLPPGTRYATPLGRVADPEVMDWRDALDRLRAADPADRLVPLVDDLAVGSSIVLVAPTRQGTPEDDTPWLVQLERAERRWRAALEDDPRLVLEREVREPVAHDLDASVYALVFTRRAPA